MSDDKHLYRRDERPEDQPEGAQGATAPHGGEMSGGYNPGPAHVDRTHGVDERHDELPERRGSTALIKPRGKELWAVAASAVLPGVGQIMLGQTAKGLVVLLFAFLSLFGFGILNIAAALDAYCVAATRRKRPVGDWELFPDIKDVFESVKSASGSGLSG